MFSHVVIWWTHPEIPNAPDELIAGAEKYLRPISLAKQFNVGKMVPSDRPVVDQSYQVAMHVEFSDKQDQDEYQMHPMHLEFVEKYSRLWSRVVVYDFE
jgi:hypothetical protein